ncbi:MAG: hypothetical protein ACI37Z_03590 [Candidatus Gastranaerophilaceae bacterium]
MKKRILWTDIDLDFKDWKSDLKEEYPELDEDGLIKKMYEINSEYLYDIRDNLDIQLSQPIVILADLDLWNKTVKAVKIIKSGNIRDCFYSNTDMANGI